VGFDATAVTHTALAVPDLDEAMAAYSASLGLSWARPQAATMHIRSTSGDQAVPIRFTYSVEGPPHLELIEGEAGSVWAPTPGLHHVGVWTDALAEDAAALEANGLPVEVAGLSRSGRSPSGFTYHRSMHGLRIELVDDRSRPAFERWFAGGDLR
jgi:catechol 2,3-dioxygenase-like lactoylglutathione lyase family enzyme